MPRSKDFRYVYANSFSFNLTDNDATISLGITDKPQGEPHEEIALVLTPKSLKLLAHMANIAVGKWEEVSGAPIPLAMEKILEIDDRMKVTKND